MMGADPLLTLSLDIKEEAGTALYLTLSPPNHAREMQSFYMSAKESS